MHRDFSCSYLTFNEITHNIRVKKIIHVLLNIIIFLQDSQQRLPNNIILRI